MHATRQNRTTEEADSKESAAQVQVNVSFLEVRETKVFKNTSLRNLSLDKPPPKNYVIICHLKIMCQCVQSPCFQQTTSAYLNNRFTWKIT